MIFRGCCGGGGDGVLVCVEVDVMDGCGRGGLLSECEWCGVGVVVFVSG